jgi:hypothetical protein
MRKKKQMKERTIMNEEWGMGRKKPSVTQNP